MTTQTIITVSMDADLLEKVEKFKGKESRSRFIRDAIEAYIETKKQK